MSRFIAIILLLFIVSFVYSEELLINVGTLPNDAIIRTAGDKPIKIVIPNKSATNIFTIAFESSRRWDSKLGSSSYNYNMTLLSTRMYSSAGSADSNIENFFVNAKVGFRGIAELCFNKLYPLSTSVGAYANCTYYMAFHHTGKGIYSGKDIPDSYYPMIFYIDPVFDSYTTYIGPGCASIPAGACTSSCPCITTGGTSYDETYFYTTRRVTSSGSTTGNSRLVSIAANTEQSLMIFMTFVYVVFTLINF